MFKSLLIAGLLTALAPAAWATTLTTTFANNNGQSGNMFDVTIGANDITLESFDLNVDGVNNIGLRFYIREGTYLGNQFSSSGWTLNSTGTVDGVGSGSATNWDVTDFVLSANTTYAFYLTATNGTHFNYTNGSSAGAVAASNSDLTIFEGTGNRYAFGTAFSPRVWNGSINYSVNLAPVPLPAGIVLLGAGLLGLGALSRRKNSAA